MGQQGNAVRSANALHTWLSCDKGFDNFQVSQHSCRKQGRPSAVCDQVFGDGPIAHVRRGTESILPVSEAPVPGGPGQRGSSVDELLDAFEVEVGDGDQFAHKLGWLSGELVGDGSDQG